MGGVKYKIVSVFKKIKPSKQTYIKNTYGSGKKQKNLKKKQWEDNIIKNMINLFR